MSAITAEASVISQKIDWARDHLFNSRGNTILSIAGLALWAAFAFLIIKFVFFDANWGLIALNRRLFFVGSYPSDELWRIWIPVFLTAALAAFSYGVWGGSLRPYFISVGAAAFLLLVLGLGSDAQITETPFTDTIRASDGSTTVVSGLDKDLVLETGWAPRWLYALSFGLALPFGASWLLLAGVFGTLGGAAVLGRRVASWGGSPVVPQAVGAGWVLLIPFALLLQYGVPTIQLESAFLDVLVFAVGGFFSFFIGLVLALARISPYRAVRLTAVGYIEVVRAGPLLVWLLFATFLKDELGPVGEAFSSISLVFRIMIVFAFFGGAYIAEVIRGGLQSIPSGQYEGSEALGLSAFGKYRYIILPQALAAVIPAIIGRFIALWKDTALLAAISMVNTLEKGKKVLAGQSDLADGSFFEIYVIVGLVYWTVSYLLSRLGGAAEQKLATVDR